MSPLVILTRPEGRNSLLAKRLNAGGIATLELPALSIRPAVYDPARFPMPGDYDLIVFVSGNAVRLYLEFLTRSGRVAAWPSSTLVATVGQASARPLYEAGFIPHSNIFHPRLADQAQDSEALWASLQQLVHPLKKILIVRGETGREWLGQQFESAGACVRRYSIYRREPVIWSTEQSQGLKAAINARHPLVCLLTSAESAAAVHVNTEKNALHAFWQQTKFVVIHERVASHLRSLVATTSGKVCDPVVKICSPDDDEIFQTLVSTVSL